MNEFEKDLIIDLLDYCRKMNKFHYEQSEMYLPSSDVCRYHEIKAECYGEIINYICNWIEPEV